jgi:hypothetical protein
MATLVAVCAAVLRPSELEREGVGVGKEGRSLVQPRYEGRDAGKGKVHPRHKERATVVPCSHDVRESGG